MDGQREGWRVGGIEEGRNGGRKEGMEGGKKEWMDRGKEGGMDGCINDFKRNRLEEDIKFG